MTAGPFLGNLLLCLTCRPRIMISKGRTKIAKNRGQSLAQMALSWVLRHQTMTSALIGARTVKQLDECLDSQNNLGVILGLICLFNKYKRPT